MTIVIVIVIVKRIKQYKSVPASVLGCWLSFEVGCVIVMRFGGGFGDSLSDKLVGLSLGGCVVHAHPLLCLGCYAPCAFNTKALFARVYLASSVNSFLHALLPRGRLLLCTWKL